MSTTASSSLARPALFSTRKMVHISMLGFAFLLPFLTWSEAVGAAMLALLFNMFVLPRLGADLDKPMVRAVSRAIAGPAGEPPSVAEMFAGPWTGIVIYPISVLVLILIFRRHMEIAAGAWAIMALGDGLASVVGGALGGPVLPYNSEKTWTGFGAFIIAGAAGAWVLTRWVAPSVPSKYALTVCLATAVVGALVEGVPMGLDDNLTVPLASGCFMYCAYLIEGSALSSNLPYLGVRLALAIPINLAFALAALRLRTLNRSGAAVGFALGVLVYLGWGWKSFALLLAFFLLGSLSTRAGFRQKMSRGIAEHRGGARSWREALANGVAPAFFSVLVLATHREAAFLLALVASLGEAAGDTVSSEIGEWLSPQAYLVTTFTRVPAGENGGVSLAGTAAGIAASAVIVALGYALGLCRAGLPGAVAALAAAIAGNLFDSLLGATLERRSLVTNGIVNFTGAAFAGALAFVWMLGR